MKRRLRYLIGFILIFLCLAVTVGNGTLHGQAVIAEVPVESLPGGVGANPNTNYVYITTGCSTVSVINGATNKVIATIEVGTNPSGVGVNPNTNRVYVANMGSDTVSVVDGGTNKVIATMEVGTRPSGVGVNPNTNRVYVANMGSNTVSVVDGGTNKVIATVREVGCPTRVGVNPNTNRIYVVNRGFSNVCVINGATNQVIATVRGVGCPGGVGVNTNSNRVYVVNKDPDNVSVLDGATNKVIATVPLETSPNINHNVAINSNTNRVYVTNRESNTVSVIDDEITNKGNKLRDEFIKKNRVEEWPNISEFFANPFIYEGKIVALPVSFQEMQSATQGIFSDVRNPFQAFVVSDIPKGMFKISGTIVVLAGKVLGKTKLEFPLFGLMQVPHLKFVGVHFCKENNCKDIIPE